MKNIRRYRKSFTDTTFFLILIICLLTSFLTIRSSTIKNNILESEYREGADLRIDTVIPVNITDFENKLEPLSTKSGQTSWDAYITGKQELFELSAKLSLQIDSIYQDKAVFNYLKNLKQKEIIKDALLKRQLDILYKAYLSKQINPELNKQITELATKLENTFGNFRAEADGKQLSDNEVTQILKKNLDSEYREKVWRAQKTLGQ